MIFVLYLLIAVGRYKYHGLLRIWLTQLLYRRTLQLFFVRATPNAPRTVI